MLSTQDNEKITRVGRGTPMGELLRRFWVPFLQAWELPEPDCDPVRVTLMGERLVAFRDTNNQLGLVSKYCPHRRADLFFGRNEEGGLRCTYHGWKFDVAGACVDMPTESPERRFGEKVRLTAYPVVERAGVLWAYLGPKNLMPEMPEFEWMHVPESHRHISWNHQETNFVQAVEGGIDSAHVNFLHSSVDAHRQKDNEPVKEGARDLAAAYMNLDTQPKFHVQKTGYGLVIGARRSAGKDGYYWRLNNFFVPFYTTPPGTSWHAFVPLDDEHTARWCVTWRIDRPYTAAEMAQFRKGMSIHSELIPGTHFPTHNKSNDYQIDRYTQRHYTFTGIKDFGAQDYSVQEGMDPISDRSQEHLGMTDAGIIQMRRMLLSAATDLQEGTEPVWANNGEAYLVHGAQMLLPEDAVWGEDDGFTEATAGTWWNGEKSSSKASK
ncbi:MAG: Rieske 2Fe-2S domain-containing protein [Nitrospirales bacterium]